MAVTTRVGPAKRGEGYDARNTEEMGRHQQIHGGARGERRCHADALGDPAFP